MRNRGGKSSILSGVLRSRLVAVAAIGAGISSAACGSSRGEEDTGKVAQPMLGDVATWGATCNPTYQNVIRKTLWYGRVAANSNAFQDCMSRSMSSGYEGKGPYKKCKSDPFAADPIATQITKAVAAGRVPNAWSIACDGAAEGALGQALVGSYGRNGPEEITLGTLFQNKAWKAETTAAYGITPYPVLAETLWHEAYHQRGYDHGASRSDDAAQVARENARHCGQQGDASYHYQVNSLSYIAGRCIGLVLEKAEAACGIMERCPVNSSLMLPTSIDSTTCGCVADPNPAVSRGPFSDDADHDGIPNANDNCPYTWNAGQENCNALAEHVRNPNAPAVGDACDPVPCASTETWTHLKAVSCVPNPPPAQDSEACSGTREEDELSVEALGPHLRGGGKFRKKIASGSAYFVRTEFRFCQNNLGQNRDCDRDATIADAQLTYFPSAEAELFDDDFPWHRVTMESHTRGDTLSWDYGGSAGFARQSAKWMYGADLPFWLGRPAGATIWTPSNNPSCTDGGGNCLNGWFWVHPNTDLGVTAAVISGVDYGAHGPQLANAYFPIKPSQGNIGWCPIPSPFDFSSARTAVSANVGLSPMLTQSSLLWRDTGTKRRIDLRSVADTELIVSTTSRSPNIFAALQDVGAAIALQGSQLSQNCGGDSMTSGLATALRTVPHWISAVEPDARIGALSSDLMAVALSARHRSIVDAALVSNDSLISTTELPPLQAASRSNEGSSSASLQQVAISTADEIVGGGVLPSDRDGWIPIFSRAAEGVFLVGSSPSELWFKRLGASYSWTQLNANVLPAAGTVLAATYSFRDKHLWMLHQAPSDAAICLMRLDPFDTSPNGATRNKLGCWNYSGVDVYLTVDREGDVLVTTSGDLGAGPLTATARIGFDAQQEPYISATAVNPGILAYPPIVSRRSYAFVVQSGTSFTIQRQAELASASSPLSSFQTHMGKTCGSLSVSGSLASPQPAGAAITFTASSTCDPGVGPEYRFWRKDPGHPSAVVQDWGGPSYSWSTASLDSGDYAVRVEMRPAGSKADFDASASTSYSITAPTGRCGELTAWLNQGVIAPAGKIQLFATTTCSQGAVPEYRVELTAADGTEYVLQNWAPTVTGSITSPSTTLGEYVVRVLARRQGSTADYQSRSVLGLTVRRGTCETVTATGPSIAYNGSTAQLGGQATCTLGALPEYRFLVTRVATGQTTVVNDWSPYASVNWIPSGYALGSYLQTVEVRRYGTGAYEGVATRSFKICSAAGGICP